MNEGDGLLRQRGWARLRGKLFHLWFLLTRPMTLGARAVVYDEAAKAVFLIEHTYVPGWQLPGGGVEAGETMLQALTRELAEEGNIELTGEPRLMSIHQNRHATRRDHVAVYLATRFRQPAPKLPDRDIRGADVFALEAFNSWNDAL